MTTPHVERANPRFVELRRQLEHANARYGKASAAADEYLFAAVPPDRRLDTIGPIDDRHAELVAAEEAVFVEVVRLEQAIADTLAMTYADLLLKLEIATSYRDLEGSLENPHDIGSGDNPIFAAFVSDLARLAGCAS